MNRKQIYMNEEKSEVNKQESLPLSAENVNIGVFLFLMTCTMAAVLFSSLTQ